MFAGPRVLMLKFTSVSGSVRAITDIPMPVLFGTADIVIIAIIIPMITGAKI